MSKTIRRALIVIDVQNDYFSGNLPIEYPPAEQSLANIETVIDTAKAASIPFVAVQNILSADYMTQNCVFSTVVYAMHMGFDVEYYLMQQAAYLILIKQVLHRLRRFTELFLLLLSLVLGPLLPHRSGLSF
ncbi:isochorismatase family protein [Utexia brackfieldae]